MPRIKIVYLPPDTKISAEEMRKIQGGRMKDWIRTRKFEGGGGGSSGEEAWDFVKDVALFPIRAVIWLPYKIYTTLDD